MLDHYDVRGGTFEFGIRPAATRHHGWSLMRTLVALLDAAADLDAMVYGAKLAATLAEADRLGAGPYH